MKYTSLIAGIILPLIAFAGEIPQKTETTDLTVKVAGGGIDGTFLVKKNETSCGVLNWDGVPNKKGEMSGGRYEILVQMVNDSVVLTERTLAAHEGISSDISAKTIIPIKKLPWTGKISQTTVTVYRVDKAQEDKIPDKATPDACVAGSVQSLPGKTPVANARVLVQGTTSDRIPWSLEGKTDAGGRFCVGAVPANSPVVVVVSKVMEGMGWFQVQAETTLAPGEKRDLGVLTGGVCPPPMATPENAHLLEPQEQEQRK